MTLDEAVARSAAPAPNFPQIHLNSLHTLPSPEGKGCITQPETNEKKGDALILWMKCARGTPYQAKRSDVRLPMNITPLKDIPHDVRKMAVAVHEAGHAITAIVLKRDVTGAIIRANGLSGETQMKPTPEVMLDLKIEANRHKVEDAIRVLLAGQIAEAAYWATQAHLYRPFVDSHRDDDAEIDRMLAAFPYDDAEKLDYRRHCIKHVKNYLDGDQAKAAIAEIAQKLVDTNLISRADLDDIMRKHDLLKEAGDVDT